MANKQNKKISATLVTPVVAQFVAGSSSDAPTVDAIDVQPVPAAAPSAVVDELPQETLPPSQSSDAAEKPDDTFLVENADAAIKRGGQKFYDYYGAYKNLRDIARPLNGKSQSAPIPYEVNIKRITIEFEMGGQTRTVDISPPQRIGVIAPLISFGIRDVIEKMNNELHVLSHLVTGMHTAVQNAFNARAMAPPNEAYDNTNTQQ